MPFYLRQSTYTAETWVALAQNPENRELGVRAAAEQFGCRLVFFGYTSGDFDVVAIFEGPDEATVSALMLASVLSGMNQWSKTTALVSGEELMGLLSDSKSTSLRRPES